jgi:molecular chaperone DnaK
VIRSLPIKKAAIEAGLEKLKELMLLKTWLLLKPAQEELNAAWTAASEDMYKASAEAGGQPGADAGQAGGGQPEGGADNVTDVDFEEVK